MVYKHCVNYDGDHDVPSDCYWQDTHIQGKEIWKAFTVDTEYFHSTTYICRGIPGGGLMAKYIECDTFIADQMHLYCDNCERRKGIKNGKMKFVYDIGDAPCRSCGIGDMLNSIEDYPAADVVPVRHGQNVSESGFLCSVCGFGDFGGFEGFEPKYCPWCGARKDGDGDV